MEYVIYFLLFSWLVGFWPNAVPKASDRFPDHFRVELASVCAQPFEKRNRIGGRPDQQCGRPRVHSADSAGALLFHKELHQLAPQHKHRRVRMALGRSEEHTSELQS